MTTAYVTHPDCLRHEMGPGHPEAPERLIAVNAEMRSGGLLESLRCLEAPLVADANLKRVHRRIRVQRRVTCNWTRIRR
jgi:acetoin utilization deacetylase AcuC-like enzyme